MSKTEPIFPADVFVSLHDLLKMEHIAQNFSLRSSGQKVNSILGGKHASRLRGRGLDFEEVRNYVKGDDIRNIDWKVTARTQKTHTRVFSEEKEKPVLIVIDQSKSMFFGSQRRTKSVVAAELAAMLAFRVLKEGDRVGGIVFADGGVDVVPPKRNRKSVLRLLDKIVQRNHELADSKAVEFEATLKEVTMKIRNIVTHDFLVFVISDFHRYSPQVMKYLTQIRQHNDVVLAKVFDPMERDIPRTKYTVGDSDVQIAVDGTNADLRAKFLGGFDDDLRVFQAELKKRRIPLFTIDTITPIEDQIKVHFRGKTR